MKKPGIYFSGLFFEEFLHEDGGYHSCRGSGKKVK
jgi:hypothetical protein